MMLKCKNCSYQAIGQFYQIANCTRKELEMLADIHKMTFKHESVIID